MNYAELANVWMTFFISLDNNIWVMVCLNMCALIIVGKYISVLHERPIFTQETCDIFG